MAAKSVQVAGFTVIPTKFTKESEVGHYLYARAHNIRESDTCKPRDRTLFVLNVPPYVTEACLERLFGSCGKVQHVFVHKKPTSSAPSQEDSEFFKMIPPITGFKVAYVVFEKTSALQSALNTPFESVKVLSTKEHPLKVGMRRWCEAYQKKIPKIKKMQNEIDLFMIKYDKEIQEEKEKEKEMDGQEDEDGWVTVTKQGKHKGIPRTEVQEKKVSNREKKRRKEKELLNFYSFQQRETKREHIAQLRQKFEEDKQKIMMMKANRKFRPY